MRTLSPVLALLFLTVAGCATSFGPAESTTSLTKGPQAIAVEDDDGVRLQQLFVRGLTRALVDDHRQAVFLFEQAIQLDPNQPAIHMALAESHAALGELEVATYYAEQAVRLDTENRSYTIYLSELLHRHGRLDEALTVLQGWLDENPRDIDASFRMADLLSEMGRQQDALAVYEELLRHEGDEIQIRYRMLKLYNGLGNLSGMRDTVRRMLTIDPTNSSLLHLLSEVYIELDSTNAAISVLEQAVEDDPTDVSTLLLLSKLYREAGRDTEAEVLIRRTAENHVDGSVDKMALASDLYARSASDVLAAQRAEELLGEMIESGVETPEVLFMLGDLRYRSAEYSTAAPLLLKAAQREPRRVEAWTKSSLAFLKSGASTEALEVSREALILFPGNYPLLRVAGQASLRTGHPEEAIAYSETALQVIDAEKTSTDNTVEMYLLQAAAYRALDVPEGAEKILRSALDLQKHNVEARYWLVLVLLDQDGRRQEAVDQAKANLDDHPQEPAFFDAMGWVEHIEGRNDVALTWLRRAVGGAPDDPRVHEHLGDVLVSVGNVEEALEQWKQAQELDPGNVTLSAKIEQHR